MKEVSEFLLESLDDLEKEYEAGELAESDFQLLRTSYERRALDAVLEDDTVHKPRQLAAPQAFAKGSSARWKIALAVVLASATVIVSTIIVDRATGSRLPGQAITGSLPPSLGNELVDAQAALAKGDSLTALRLFQSVLSAQYNQPEALAYWGWIVASAGISTDKPELIQRGLSSIESAIKVDPRYPDAYLLLGLINVDTHRPEAAIAELHHFLMLSPPSPEARLAKLAISKAQAALPNSPK